MRALHGVGFNPVAVRVLGKRFLCFMDPGGNIGNLRKCVLRAGTHSSSFRANKKSTSISVLTYVYIYIYILNILYIIYTCTEVRLRHPFTRHRLVGQALPLGFLWLHLIWPRTHADWTFVPHWGQECVCLRTTRPLLTRNCLPQ